jgi:glycosyltransferase involved in cell wall biosynthesis
VNPSLSVIIPTYNGERFIAAAFDSVRQQGTEGLELVVVDDGSSDRTLDIVNDFSKLLPIRLITPGRSGNWVAGSNIGLRAAKGDWACFLHQDDFWLPGRIARLRREMESAKGALVLHNAMFVGPQGQDLGPWTCPLPKGDVPSVRFIERLLIQNFIAIPSPVFRRKAVIDFGGLDEGLWYAADWDLWLRLGALGPVRFVSETLCAFRIHKQSQTMARKLSPNEWEEQLAAVFDRHLENGPFAENFSTSVARVAKASIAVNAALAAASRGEPVKTSSTLVELLALGPSGWHRYLRDSGILQRVRPRLKLQRLPPEK